MLANQPKLCPGGTDCYPAKHFSALEENTISIFETVCVEIQENHGNLTPNVHK